MAVNCVTRISRNVLVPLITVGLLAIGCSTARQVESFNGELQDDNPLKSDQPLAAEVPADSEALSGAGEAFDDGQVLSLDHQIRVRRTVGLGELDEEQFEVYADDLRRAAYAQEEFIQGCMTNRGFEYFLKSLGSVVWRPGFAVPIETKEWADIYGFGISTTALPDRITSPVAVGYVGPDPIDPDISETSAESRYLNTMDTPTYRSYSIALNGFDPEDASHTDENLSQACRQLAEEEHPSPYEPTISHLEVAQRLLASTEWIDYEQDAKRCLANQDIKFWTDVEINQHMNPQLIQLEANSVMDQLQDGQASEEALAQLASVQTYERELAGKFWDCSAHPIQQGRMFTTLLAEFRVADGWDQG